MNHSTSSTFGLQSLLFSKEEISTCFFRNPTDRELEFMSYFHGVQSLLSPNELFELRKSHLKGRIGYDLIAILGIQLLKTHYRQPTMKETLLLLQENEILRNILGTCRVPSTASASRLARKVEKVVKLAVLHERLTEVYERGMNRMVGHLSIDSTTILAREKPFVRSKEVDIPATTVTKKKRGRKRKVRPKKRHSLRKGQKQNEKKLNISRNPLKNLSRS